MELRKNLFSLGNNKSNVEIGRANDENDSDDGGAGGAKKASVTMEGNKEEPNHDFGSAMIDSTNQNYNRINGKHANHTTTDPTSNNKINVNNNIYAKRGKRARMARFINTRFSRRLSSSQSTAMANDNTASDVTTNTNNNNNNKKKTKLSSSSSLTEEEYQKRKAAWAAKYTSVSTLRTTFGTNKNRLWGDFDPKTTRQLYHTLLPRALLGLHDMGLSKVDELAPLAYQARVAAKKYARERSMLPGRIGSMLYDGFRQWKRYGKFDHRGMTWEQVWRKYEDQVLKEVMEEIAREEEEEEEHEAAVAALRQVTSATEQALLDYADALDDEELTARICLRILERSVVTNEAIDKLFLKRIMNGEEEEYDDEDEEDFEQADYLSDSDKLSLSSNMSSISASSATKKGRKQVRQERQRRRKLRIQADLRAIEKKFDHDIRALLLSGGGMDSSANKDVREGSNNKMRRRRRSSFFWSKSSSSFTSRRKSGFTANEDVDDAPSLNMDGESAAAFARGGAETAMESFGSLDQPPTELEIAAAIISMTEDPASIDFEYDSEDLGTTSDANDSVHKSSFALNDEDTSATITATSTSTTTNQRKKLFRKLSVHEVFALRILATTKHRIASLHSLSNFNGDKKEEEDDDEDLKF